MNKACIEYCDADYKGYVKSRKALITQSRIPSLAALPQRKTGKGGQIIDRMRYFSCWDHEWNISVKVKVHHSGNFKPRENNPLYDIHV